MDSAYKVGQKVIVDECVVSEIQAVYKVDGTRRPEYYYSIGGISVRKHDRLELITEIEESKHERV